MRKQLFSAHSDADSLFFSFHFCSILSKSDLFLVLHPPLPDLPLAVVLFGKLKISDVVILA